MSTAVDPADLTRRKRPGSMRSGLLRHLTGIKVGQRLLGVAIVNYRGATDAAGLVRSIVGTLRGPDIDIALAIVDNSDEADELAPVMGYATANGISAALLQGQGNVGYAAGNNLAARWLLGQGVDAIWVLNPDARISAGSLDTVADLLETGCRAIGATVSPGPGGTVRPGLGTLDLWTGRSRPAPDDGTRPARRLVYPAGHSLLLTAPAWRALGGFCGDFF